MGQYLLQQLRALQPRYPFLGDVRGLGLMVGIECVRDAGSKQHAPMLAKWIKERMAQRQVGAGSVVAWLQRLVLPLWHSGC